MTGGLFLGVDGGGSKTEVVVIDEAGAVLARAAGPGAYHPQAGLAGVEAVLRDALAAVLGRLEVGPEALAGAFFGLPAHGEDEAADPRLHALAGALLGHDRYLCGNDMVCGWAGAFACGDGVNLVAGTGSIGYGERAGGAARAGGWGEVFGDEGSAYWIAVRGLNAFSRMSDGRLARGPLHTLLREALALRDDIDLCARMLGPGGLPRSELAALAPQVARAAELGDSAAAAILAEAAGELLAVAVAVRSALGYAPGEVAPLSWSGGVLANLAAVRARLGELAQSGGAFRLLPPLHPPGYGAALYARHLARRGRLGARGV